MTDSLALLRTRRALRAREEWNGARARAASAVRTARRGRASDRAPPCRCPCAPCRCRRRAASTHSSERSAQTAQATLTVSMRDSRTCQAKPTARSSKSSASQLSRGPDLGVAVQSMRERVPGLRLRSAQSARAQSARAQSARAERMTHTRRKWSRSCAVELTGSCPIAESQTRAWQSSSTRGSISVLLARSAMRAPAERSSPEHRSQRPLYNCCRP
jgi:hypothetical protein